MSQCVETVAPAEYLSWDSDFFGHRIARVKDHTMSDAMAEALEQWSRSEQIEVVYFLARADCLSSVQTAQTKGFYLTDIRITLTTEECYGAGAAPLDNPGPVFIRPAQPQDLPALEAIARRSHRDTRFFCDPRFSRTRVEQLYATWIRLECEGKADQVLVAASPAGPALGYISCHVDRISREGEIGLLATHESIRGQGVGKRLVGAAFDWFSRQGTRRISVVTQGRNTAGQRLYQRCGFITSQVQLWLHCWRAGS
jgi:dTDP-4-amino-4,6-dideoxy-D-galactose acyltransferase